MKLSLILGIAMSVTMFIWIIIIAVILCRSWKREARMTGFIFKVKCRKCKKGYEVGMEEYVKPVFSYSVSVSKPQLVGPAIVSVKEYKSIAKRFRCPYCEKKHWANVINYDEFVDIYKKPFVMEGLKKLLIMFIGGTIIMVAFSVPIKIVAEKEKEAARKEAQRMYQQRYEEIMQHMHNNSSDSN